jgi:hypothetical protein
MAKVEKRDVVPESFSERVPAEEFDMDAYLSEPVPFYAFKDNDKYKDDITVGVNGKIFRIKRGVQVMIPRNVYNVLMRSMEQDAKTADMISNQANAFAEETRRFGY